MYQQVCHIACKVEHYDIVEQMAFSINLNAQHVHGMTHFDLAVHSGKLDTLEYTH